jgi:hypothetical protein
LKAVLHAEEITPTPRLCGPIVDTVNHFKRSERVIGEWTGTLLVVVGTWAINDPAATSRLTVNLVRRTVLL